MLSGHPLFVVGVSIVITYQIIFYKRVITLYIDTSDLRPSVLLPFMISKIKTYGMSHNIYRRLGAKGSYQPL